MFDVKLKHLSILYRGVARIFQRGGHTVSNIIVMAFSPRNIIGCFLKKGLQKGGGGLANPVFASPSVKLRRKSNIRQA